MLNPAAGAFQPAGRLRPSAPEFSFNRADNEQREESTEKNEYHQQYSSQNDYEKEWVAWRTAFSGGQVSTVAFDEFSECIWAGVAGSSGRVTGFKQPSEHFGSSLNADDGICSSFCTQFGADATFNTSGQAVMAVGPLQILTTEMGVLTLGSPGLSLHTRGGMPVLRLHAHSIGCTNFTSMDFANASDRRTIVLGAGTKLCVYDLDSQRIAASVDALNVSHVRTVQGNGSAAAFGSGEVLAVAHGSGVISLRDLRRLGVPTQMTQAHTGGVSSLAVRGNLIATCGYSQRFGGGAPDSFVQLFDIRTFQPLSTIPWMAPFTDMYQQATACPTFVDFVGSQGISSNSADELLCASASGHFQFMNITEAISLSSDELQQQQQELVSEMYDASELSGTAVVQVTCAAVAPSEGVVCLCDSQGLVMQFARQEPEAGFDSSDPITCEIEPMELPPMPEPPFLHREAVPGSTPEFRYALRHGGTSTASDRNEISRLSSFVRITEAGLDSGETPLSQFAIIRDKETALAAGKYASVGIDAPGLLLSDWGSEIEFRVPRPRRPIDPTVFPDYRKVDFVTYARNPGTLRRGLYARLPNDDSGLPATPVRAQTRSVRGLSDSDGMSPSRKLDAIVSAQQRESAASARPPKAYRHKDIEHNHRLGIAGFDFAKYNQTRFAGLENTLPMSYCNSFLQLLFFIPRLRAALSSHFCSREQCLACETGFLFQMLESAARDAEERKSSGERNVVAVCQASNLLRAFRQIPEGVALGLAEPPEDDDVSVVRAMHRFILFFTEQLAKETSSPEEPRKGRGARSANQLRRSSIIDEMFGGETTLHSRCSTCGATSKRTMLTHHFDMSIMGVEATGQATRSSSAQAQRKLKDASFSRLLASALTKETQVKAWCEACRKYQTSTQRREVLRFPNILAINAGATKADMAYLRDLFSTLKSSKANADWLPLSFRARSVAPTHADSREIQISRFDDGAEDAATILAGQNDVDAIYDLTATIAHSHDPARSVNIHSQLVAQVRTPTQSGNAFEWFTFNDFTVTGPNDVSEVCSFLAKTPAVLTFTRRDARRDNAPESKSALTLDDFFASNSIGTTGQWQHSPTFQPLLRFGQDEFELQRGDIVAIDAEFVSLSAEEKELQNDGTTVVTNPIHFSLARVSCVRCTIHGEVTSDSGVPFMDDYVATQESTIADYLTRFSGIVPGDLTPAVSRHHVMTLKAVYAKLKVLIDRGVKFLGHGLAKDFRIINMYVPDDNIIDTVKLFHIPGQRLLSLRFLAHVLLESDIQVDTHDSIEDARTTWLVYQEYLKIKGDPTRSFQDVLEHIYDVGRRCNFRVPE